MAGKAGILGRLGPGFGPERRSCVPAGLRLCPAFVLRKVNFVPNGDRAEYTRPMGLLVAAVRALPSRADVA